MKYLLFVSGILFLSLPFSAQSQWDPGTNGIYYNVGNVGIGTTSPAGKFHVFQSANDHAYSILERSNNTYQAFRSFTPAGTISITNPKWLMGMKQSSPDFEIQTYDGAFSRERLYIKADGNVGIGTTSPSKKLDVNTDVNGDGVKVGAGVTSVESSANVYLYPSSNYATSRNWVISAYYANIGDFVIRSSNAQGGDPYTAGTTRFAINNNGNVGIGTSSPATLWGKVLQVYDHNNAALSVRTPVADWQLVTDASGGLHFRDISGGGNAGRMYIGQNGNVLIGKTSQTNTSYKLDINGNARANKIVVNTTGADFVFEEDYRLRKLGELLKYIRQNKHLPEIPSAKQMEAEGLDIGDMNIKLLQKVEELTLYLIDQNKKLEEQIRKNNDQQREIEALKKHVKQRQR